MSVKEITTDDLRIMNKKEGIIFQGCAGEVQEWIDGVNELLTEAGILKEGTKFKEASRFHHEGITCLLFEFKKDVKLDIGKLSMWRLQTHSAFACKWLSDYVQNRLGGFVEQKAETLEQEKIKPDCPLLGQDGNIFNLMGLASQTLRKNGMSDAAKEMQDRIISSGSYSEALCIIGEYVNITSVDDETNEEMEDELNMKM